MYIESPHLLSPRKEKSPLLELAPCLKGIYIPAQILLAPRFTTELRSVAGLHRAKSLRLLSIRVESLLLILITCAEYYHQN